MRKAQFPIAECLKDTSECLDKITEAEANVETYNDRSSDGTTVRFNIICRGGSKIFGSCTATAILHFYPDNPTDSFG